MIFFFFPPSIFSAGRRRPPPPPPPHFLIGHICLLQLAHTTVMALSSQLFQHPRESESVTLRSDSTSLWNVGTLLHSAETQTGTTDRSRQTLWQPQNNVFSNGHLIYWAYLFSHKEEIGSGSGFLWGVSWSLVLTVCVVCAAGAGEAAYADGDALSGDQVSGTPVYSCTSQDYWRPEGVPGEAEHCAGGYSLSCGELG